HLAGRAVCFSTVSVDPAHSSSSELVDSEGSPGGAGVAHESLVLIAPPPVGRGAVAAFSEMGSVVPDGREGVASVPGPSSAHGVAAKGVWQPLAGLEPSICQTLQSAWAPSTLKAYACCWQHFTAGCIDRGLDPVLCSLHDILRLLPMTLTLERLLQP
ncbi:hypothetical protein GOODEAATRI_023391, partial [Goodea atripinnis]